MRFGHVLIMLAAAAALAACGDNNSSDPISSPDPPTPVLFAGGGSGATGAGGNGGYVNIHSYGSVSVLKSGTVDASFTALYTPPTFDGGTHHVTISADTTVLLDEDIDVDNLCMVTGDTNLYIGDGTGPCGDASDTVVTGITVDAGATLTLADNQWGASSLALSNDIVVHGSVTMADTAYSLYIEANVITVESNGKITTSAVIDGNNAGEIYLGSGTLQQVINRGIIEAKGLGSGSGGRIYLQAQDLVVNVGTIDVSGGSGDTGPGGSGGELDIYVDYGDFYSSGTVRMNGGNGTSGGDCEPQNYSFDGYSAYIETAASGNDWGRNGDIIISGTWEANGGNGTDGNGGAGGYIYLQANAMGSVTLNADMSARGGSGAGTGSQGGYNDYGIEIYSGNYRSDPLFPGTIRITGRYDLRGGNGEQDGGYGGYLYIYSSDVNAAGEASNVELVNFPAMSMNGGNGAAQGGSANDGGAFAIYTYSPSFDKPAGAITNEAWIEAKGGNATAVPGFGGQGGYVEMQTYGISDTSKTINNSGSIDISGGTGDTGGSSNGVYLQAQHVTNSGDLTAKGGSGTSWGGNGGDITLNSDDPATPTTNTGALSVAGGSGPTPGSDGVISIASGGGPM